jgi:uncharacterized phiE125 gp8 family phage protein
MYPARSYTYEVITLPAGLAVPLATFKLHAKTTASVSDALLTLYLQAAINYGEGITRRDFVNRTYKTFRDAFPGTHGYDSSYPYNTGNVGFELRRSRLQSVTSVKYLVDAVLATVDSSVYYNTSENDYSKVLTLDGQSWPTGADVRLQAIEIEFVAGYGADDTSVSDDIQDAIMQHATALLENKGDCDDAAVAASVPAASKCIYLQNRIENL